MIWFKKKKDIPIPPTPAELTGYEKKDVLTPIKIPPGDLFHEEITEPITPPTPIPNPIKSKPVMSKPAPPPRPVQKPITPVRVQPKPVQPTPPVQVQPVSKPVQPTPQVQKPESRPFFVLKRGYHILLDSIREVDVRIDTVQPTIDFLIKNKNKQDVKFEEMRIVLEDIERKLLYVDKTMFER